MTGAQRRRARTALVSAALISTALLATGLVTVSFIGCDPPDPAPTVALAESIRGELVLEREDHESRVVGAARVERGAEVRTGSDGRGSLRLDNGAWVLLDRTTTVALELGKVTHSAGRLWVDTTGAKETTVDTGRGILTATGAAFAVERSDDATLVYCGSGEVTYRSEGGDGQLMQGEVLRLAGGEPVVEPAGLWDDWTGGLADPTPERRSGPAYVGVLSGRRLDEQGEARTPLPIRGHDVRATVRGDLVETEVVQTFFNARSDVLEAEYGVRLPDGAIVQSFAVDHGAGFAEASIAALMNQEGYQLAWASPDAATSRLSYDGPDRVRARIYPIDPGATVRVKLRYTEWLTRRGDMRTYVYPMRSTSESPNIGELVLQVDTSATPSRAFRAGMGAEVRGAEVVLRASDFRPDADFYLDLLDEEEPEDDVAHAYVVGAEGADSEGEEAYVLVDIATTALVDDDDDDDDVPLELVLVVDASGATDPENLDLQRSIVEAVLRQLTPSDRVAVRIADVTAHVPEGAPDGLQEANDETREAIIDALAHVRLGGATDLGTSLRDAARLVAGRPRGAVLYLGDGIPTTGPLDATSIRRTLATVDSPPRYFALGVGDGANLDLLGALFGQHARPVRQRTEASRAVMEVLADAARPTLRGVTLELGEGVERIYPRPPIAVPDGGHIRIVGRLKGELPETVVVRGTRDGVAFDASYELVRRELEDGGDIRRRWAVGRLAELLDADAGREALVELGVRYGVITPWTSLVANGGSSYAPITGFDTDPREHAWSLGGGGPSLTMRDLGGEQGWRRRAEDPDAFVSAGAVEETWVERVPRGDLPAAREGDGGLGRAAVLRALALGRRGPEGCYERKLILRPDLAGEIAVEVSVDGQGSVREARVARSSLGAEDLDDCIVGEVRGIRFPATGGAAITTVIHTYRFTMPSRPIGVRQVCSAASYRRLESRRALWRERLAVRAGVPGALAMWRGALESCELDTWRARRTLLDMLLRHVGPVGNQVELFRAFGGDSTVGPYLRRAILANVRTLDEVQLVRGGLELDAPVDWTVFARMWKADERPEARLTLVRRWLEVVPDDIDLRLRWMALLEDTGRVAEAKRVAEDLRADPLADARVRTAVGELWLRLDNEPEARRVFSEIVERAPLDPWARKRLGDLYRAHGWFDDAYREYSTLARLRPADPGVLLDLARAAAGAGRIDEALRLEQRLSESSADEHAEGPAEFARLWTKIRLARLKLDGPAALAPIVQQRERETGALRDPPALLAMLSWMHPDDEPELHVGYPGVPEEDREWERAPLQGGAYGVEAVVARVREPGEYRFEVRRQELDRLRDVTGELMVITHPGTGDERILRVPVTLSRTARAARFRLTDRDALEIVEIPAE